MSTIWGKSLFLHIVEASNILQYLGHVTNSKGSRNPNLKGMILVHRVTTPTWPVNLTGVIYLSPKAEESNLLNPTHITIKLLNVVKISWSRT